MAARRLVALAAAAICLLPALLSGPSAAGQAPAPETIVCGTISQDQWWTTSGSPYLVTCYSEVAAGVTLHIAPGVIVRSNGDPLFIRGSLLAGGTPDQPILFTSSAPAPAPGDWRGLGFAEDHSASLLHDVVVEYAGKDGSAAIELQGGALWVRDSEVRHGSHAGITAYDGYLEVTGSHVHHNGGDGLRFATSSLPPSPRISGNTFQDNGGYALSLSADGATYMAPTLAGNTGSGNGTNGIGLAGVLNGATLDPNPGLPYVVHPLATSPGSTLTIAAGAIFKAGGDSPDTAKILVYGTLQVQGTAASPVIFTSLADDSAGGDTNADQGAVQPAPGDWRGILIEPADVPTPPAPPAPPPPPDRAPLGDLAVYLPLVVHSLPRGAAHSEIAYADVRYAGYDLANLELLGAEAEVTDSTFTFSADNGIYAQDGALRLERSVLSHNAARGLYYFGNLAAISPVLLDNRMDGNGVYAAYLVFNGGCGYATEMRGNTGSGNGGVNGLFIEGFVFPSEECHWAPNPDFPYVVWAMPISAGGRLEIEPGVVVKFAAAKEYWSPPHWKRGTGILLVGGTLVAHGTPGLPIVFTSYWDDAYGGDTNGDGSATQPLPGDWRALYVDNGGEATLAHSSLFYGGFEAAGLFCAEGGQAALEHCVVAHNLNTGLSCQPNASLEVTHSVLRDNAGSGLNNGGAAAISQSDIYGNLTYGVRCWAPGFTMQAEDNYWGAADGPSGDGTYCDPPGSGDKLTCWSVDWAPYAPSPFHQ